jgi:hypothetical protein
MQGLFKDLIDQPSMLLQLAECLIIQAQTDFVMTKSRGIAVSTPRNNASLMTSMSKI